MKNLTVVLTFLFGLVLSANALAKCPNESRFHSVEGKEQTSIRFVNDSEETVNVYWLDYQGKRVFYQTLAAGMSYEQPTYVSHPWVVEGDSCKGIFFPDAQARQVVIEDTKGDGVN